MTAPADSTSFVNSLIHLPDHAAAMGLYWTLTVCVLLDGFCAIARLHRLKEWHHLYYGAALVLVSLAFAPPAAAILHAAGLAVAADDAYQHTMQVLDLSNGKPPRPDFSPLHRLGVWLLLTCGYRGS